MDNPNKFAARLLQAIAFVLSLAVTTNSMAQPFTSTPVLKIESDHNNSDPRAPYGAVEAKTTLLTPSIPGSELKVYVKPGPSPEHAMEVTVDAKAPLAYERICIGLVPLEAIGLSRDYMGRRPVSDWSAPCGQANKAGWARLKQDLSRKDAPPSEESRDLRDGQLILVLKLGDKTVTAQVDSIYFRRDMVKVKP